MCTTGGNCVYIVCFAIEIYIHMTIYLTSLSSKVDEGVSVHHPPVVSKDVLPSLTLHLNSIEVLRPTNHTEVPTCTCGNIQGIITNASMIARDSENYTYIHVYVSRVCVQIQSGRQSKEDPYIWRGRKYTCMQE